MSKKTKRDINFIYHHSHGHTYICRVTIPREDLDGLGSPETGTMVFEHDATGPKWTIRPNV